MDTIILFSFFNSNNIGDREISGYFMENLSEYYHVIPCSNEGDFDIHNKYVAEELTLIEKIKRKICRYTNVKYLTPRYKDFIEKYKGKLDSVNFIVLGGGNVLMDYSDKTNSFTKYKEYLTFAKEKNVKCYALSIGIGPFSNKNQLKGAVETLNLCDYISFRDKQSYELFVNNGGNSNICEISIDPVISKEYERKSACNRIAINVVNPSWYGKDYCTKVFAGYVSLIENIAKQYPEKNISIFTTELNDISCLKRIYEKCSNLTNLEIRETFSIDQLTALYKDSEFVIGARMHSLIIAYACHVPIVGLSWSEKVSGFFNIINKREYCFDIIDLQRKIDEICNIVFCNKDKWEFSQIIDFANNLLNRDMEEIKYRETNKEISS